MASLEVLPLEIHESIFAYLLPHQHHKELPTLDHDYRYEKARPDIYNVRLTSRRLRAAAFQAFVWILEDLPTKFQEKTLGNLAALLELPEISSRLTYLSLLPYHLFTNETYSYNVYIIAHYSKAEFHARCAWLRDTLPETLVATIRKAPRLRHLVCVIAPLRIDFEDAEEPTYVGATSSEATDPMHVSPATYPTNGSCAYRPVFAFSSYLKVAWMSTNKPYRLCRTLSRALNCQRGSSQCISSTIHGQAGLKD
jgi:hypothetical protein